MSQQVTTGVPSEPVGPSAASPYAVTSHVVVPRDRAAGAPEAGLSASPSGSESDLASGIRISASVGDGSARWTGWNPISAAYPEPPKTRSVLPAGARPGGRVPRHEPTADARLWWLKRVEGASYPPRRGGGSRPIDGDLTDVMASPDEWRRVRVSPRASPQLSPSFSACSTPRSPTAAAPAAERPRSNLKAVEATKVFYKSRGLDDGKHVLIGVAGHFKPGLGVAAVDVVTLVGKVVRREAAQGPFVVVYFDLDSKLAVLPDRRALVALRAALPSAAHLANLKALYVVTPTLAARAWALAARFFFPAAVTSRIAFVPSLRDLQQRVQASALVDVPAFVKDHEDMCV